MQFEDFKRSLQRSFELMLSWADNLFIANVSKDLLWETYLNSFPEATRQFSNCNSCRQFIKNYGHIVAIKENKLVSIWNFKVGYEPYDTVLQNLTTLVESMSVSDVLVLDTKKLGCDSNIQLLQDNTTLRWHHLYLELPRKFIKPPSTLPTFRSEKRSAKGVFKRSLDELSIGATETALDLINQASVYRGAEFKKVLETFLFYQKEYVDLDESVKDNYCWSKLSEAITVSRIRNTAIGTFLIDLSSDLDLDAALRKYESVMAPTNYQRPKAVFTAKMVAEAEKKLAELGLQDSLARRFATPDDLSVNNVLFMNRGGTKSTATIFDQLKEDIPVDPKKLARVEEISMNDFVEKVLPTAKSISLLLENQHERNLVSLIAPVVQGAPSLFKWDNPFSWSYSSNTADSIRERVVKAGGKIDCQLRISLSWDTSSDLDLHVVENLGDHIHYAHRKSSFSGAFLDVDANAGSVVSYPVENIAYPHGSNLSGKLDVYVHNFYQRIPTKQFTVEVEYKGEVYTFEHDRLMKEREKVDITTISFSKTGDIQFTTQGNNRPNTKQLWNLTTNKFHKVNMVTWSPNYWNAEVGNKHLFFFLEGAHNPGPTRGVFNEFIKPDLTQYHKNVFEALGSKMQVQDAEVQLSGLGFSTTSEGTFLVEVESTFKRTLKVVV